ncbi:hypothetical protein [Aquipluma nitroreducens]|nr:hypothetical protein [Aquipluma nitroreducens]
MKLLPTFLLFVLIFFTSGECMAQDVFVSGSRYQALSDASVGLSDCWSVFGNQAGLAGIQRPTVGGSFQNRFLVNELSTRSGLIVYPIQSSVFAFSLSQFGQIPFRQGKYGLAFARKVTPKLNFGLQFNGYRLFLSEENRSVSSFGAELGAQYLFTDRFVVGFHVMNPYRTGVKLSSGTFRYPSRINIGSFYRLSDLFNLTTELENDFEDHFIMKTGIEYCILEKLFLRAGVAGKPYQLSGGIGFQVKRLTLDLATVYNQYLGNSPSVSFQYQF